MLKRSLNSPRTNARPAAALRRSLAAAAVAALPMSAAAQDEEVSFPGFDMPRGCETVVIVQGSDCSAAVVYTCAADPEGVRQIANVTSEGMTYHSTVDGTYTWLESLSLWDGEYFQTQLPVADPIDIAALLANGIDSFALTQVERSTGAIIHYTGYDWLSGYETEIDGVRLLETTFHVRAVYDDGTPYYEAEGTEYVDPELGLFHQGRTWYDGNPDDLWVSAPVEFVFPGEEGDTFYAPTYGCEG